MAAAARRCIFAAMNLSAHRFFADVEPDALWQWMARQRWFGGKARTVLDYQVADLREADWGVLVALRVAYADGAETYALPLAWAATASDGATILRNGAEVLCEASELPAFQSWVFRNLERAPALARLFPSDEVPSCRMLHAEQSNTSFVFGEKIFVKWFRRLVDGPNPDEELTRFLSEQTSFRNVPAFCGAVRWNGASIALATELTPNQGDAWPLALDCARRSSTEFPARLLGTRTAELHNALATGTGSDFSPEPITAHDIAELCAEISRLDLANRALLSARVDSLPAETATLARRYLSTPLRCEQVAPHNGALKTRTHGDFHLGQVLWTGGDFVIIDFEGEPSRSLAERRAKRSPLRDVAGMLRSFHYAAHVANDSWAEAMCATFLDAWKAAVPALTAGLPLLPLFVQEKALYELSYELNNRPDWLHIPLRALGAS